MKIMNWTWPFCQVKNEREESIKAVEQSCSEYII